jgi:ABC-type sulfate transport system permease component
MDWQAFARSLQLAAATALLLPFAVWLARLLAWSQFPGQGALAAAILLPLVLPPTVLGYYLLLGLGGAPPLGQAYQALTGRALVFSFDGLLVASLIFNLPFAVQPMQRAFASIPRELRRNCLRPRRAAGAGRPLGQRQIDHPALPRRSASAGLTVMTFPGTPIMKVMTVSLSSGPSPARGRGDS